MKDIVRFCLISVFFMFLFSVVYLTKWIYEVESGNYQYTLPGSETYKALRKSKQKTNKKKLIIGDSTGNQFYSVSDDDDDYYSLACNQAISLCGHFFLLDNFLKAGNRPEQVYLIFNIFTFSNNLDQEFSFHYFLKPFYNTEYKSRMSETVHRQIEKIPFYRLSQFPRMLASMWSPNYKPQKEFQLMSPISNEYLLKIDSLGREYDIEMYLIPSLIPESQKEIIYQLSSDCTGEVNEKLKPVFQSFMKEITYVNDTCFMDDKHLKAPIKFRHLIEEKMSDSNFSFKTQY